MLCAQFRKKRIIELLFFSLLIFCLNFTSCSFETDIHKELITIDFPNIPEETKKSFTFTEWVLMYIASNGNIVVKRFPISQTQTEITLHKNEITPFLCYPVLKHENALRDNTKTSNPKNTPFLETFFEPAGCIYPLGISTSRKKNMSLTWKKGFTSWFVLNAIIKSHSSFSRTIQTISFLNWQKFQKQTEKFENPWRIDTLALYAAIENEKVATYSFKELENTTEQVALPSVDWIHSSYIPTGFLYPVEKDVSLSISIFELPIGNEAIKIIERENIYYLNLKNDTKRLVITAIPY